MQTYPRWLLLLTTGLVIAGFFFTVLKGIIWIFLLFIVLAVFLLWQYGYRPAQNLTRFLEANPEAWIRYSGIPPQVIEKAQLDQRIEKIDQRSAKIQQALKAETAEDFRGTLVELEEETEEQAQINPMEALAAQLKSWDSSLFFAGSSRSGKTTATQHYAKDLKPYYLSLKPDLMPKGTIGAQASLERPTDLYHWLKPFYEEFIYRVKHRLEQEAPLWLFVDELETHLEALENSEKGLPKEAIRLYPDTVGMINRILKLGNAHQVRFGLITQSVLSKNTRLDSDSMASLAWLLCGSELGGFGAFKSERVKARCGEDTLGQVRLMVNHPDGVKGFWWLMELKSNFKLMPAPAPIAKTELEQIPHFDPNKHPFQGRKLEAGETVDLDQADQPVPPKNDRASKLGQGIKTGLVKLRDNVRNALGVEDQDLITVPVYEVQRTALDDELEKIKAAIAGNAELEAELEQCLPTLTQLFKDQRLELLRIARLSMERGFITIRQIQKIGSPDLKKSTVSEIKVLLEELSGFYYLGSIYPDRTEGNIGYLAFYNDNRAPLPYQEDQEEPADQMTSGSPATNGHRAVTPV